MEHNVAQVCGNLWWDPINRDGTPKGYQLFRECGGEFSWEIPEPAGRPATAAARMAAPAGGSVSRQRSWPRSGTGTPAGRSYGTRTAATAAPCSASRSSTPTMRRIIDSSEGRRAETRQIAAAPHRRTSISRRVLRLRHATIEVVATDRFGRRYSERITLEKAQ